MDVKDANSQSDAYYDRRPIRLVRSCKEKSQMNLHQNISQKWDLGTKFLYHTAQTVSKEMYCFPMKTQSVSIAAIKTINNLPVMIN